MIKCIQRKAAMTVKFFRHKNIIIVTGYVALYHSDFWLTASLCPTVL